MDPSVLTVRQAAATTGWSARMLRYVDEAGLVRPARSDAGYRLYGPAELQRLRTLRELLEGFDLGLGDVSFASRMQADPVLRDAVSDWLEGQAVRPGEVDAAQWLRYEQHKHTQLLAAVAAGRTRSPAAAAAGPTKDLAAVAAGPTKDLAAAAAGPTKETR